jgi:hypothetical protein
MSSRISQRMRSRRNQCNNAGLLHHPAVHAQAGTIRGAAAGDHRSDSLVPDLAAVLVMVIAPVGVDPVWPLPRPAPASADRRDRREQRHQLGDVVTLPAGQRHRQRDPVRLGDQVVSGARPGAVDRARARFGRPSPRARASCRSPPWTSPAPRPRAARPAAPRAAAATRLPGASPAAAASTSSRTRTPAPAARTPTGSRCTARTRSRTAPGGQPAACGRDERPAAGRRAAAAGSGPRARPGRSTVAVAPSSRPGPTIT